MKYIFGILSTVLLLTACAGEVTPPTAMTTLETTQAVTMPPTTTATLPEETLPVPTQPEITAPEELTGLLEANGLSLEDLAQQECGQLVTVVAEGNKAAIDLYILQDHLWQRQEALACAGFVGRKGIAAEKYEGDKTTPQGFFPIREGFYLGDAPESGLSLFAITPDTYWVDDPGSRYYNRRVEGTENKDWTSAEHMADYSASYEYGFVIGYNPEAIPYAGSAIFFHVGSRSTTGCVATERDFVLQYLAALEEARNPYILICPAEAAPAEETSPTEIAQ